MWSIFHPARIINELKRRHTDANARTSGRSIMLTDPRCTMAVTSLGTTTGGLPHHLLLGDDHAHYYPCALRAAAPVYADPAAVFIAVNDFDQLTFVRGRARVVSAFDALKSGLGHAHIHYAAKVNPEPQVISTLVLKGSGFPAF
ncbi:MAG: hypothetical protein WBG95_15010 [Sulfitobacter sp.]